MIKKLLPSNILDYANTVAKFRQTQEIGVKCYPIPRGGVPAAFALLAVDPGIEIASTPEEADFFLDDIIDSGATMEHWCDSYPGKPFLALVDKTTATDDEAWYLFPWEKDISAVEDDSIVATLTNRIKRAGAPYFANDNVSEFISVTELGQLQHEVARRAEHFLRGLLIDVDNDHNTTGTAERMAKMFLQEVFKGRYLAPPRITSFPNAKGLDEVYTTGPISIRSACSHHIVPILGQCWIGIIPGEKVIGLSKFNRIVDWFASRGQIQEEMTVQIADFIENAISPKGLAVVIKATHECMVWRGVKEHSSAAMTTSVMRGAFRSSAAARAEFFSLAGIQKN